ncbi:hypothetical protein C8240_00475 [Paracidovorax cattleyae]|nr:hypothetical protein C8240_00475 [Paracidovorax cattleyae]
MGTFHGMHGVSFISWKGPVDCRSGLAQRNPAGPGQQIRHLLLNFIRQITKSLSPSNGTAPRTDGQLCR